MVGDAVGQQQPRMGGETGGGSTESKSWSRKGYQQPYPHYGLHPEMTQKFDAPLVDAPRGQEAAQPKKKSRVGVLVAGTARGGHGYAGAVAAVAVVDHSGQSAPVAQAPVADRVGKPSPIHRIRSGAARGQHRPGRSEQVSAKVLPSVVKLQIETGQEARKAPASSSAKTD